MPPPDCRAAPGPGGAEEGLSALQPEYRNPEDLCCGSCLQRFGPPPARVRSRDWAFAYVQAELRGDREGGRGEVCGVWPVRLASGWGRWAVRRQSGDGGLSLRRKGQCELRRSWLRGVAG